MKARVVVLKRLMCSKCGAEFPLARRIHSDHKAGHVKHLWCYRCKRVTAHIESAERSFYRQTL